MIFLSCPFSCMFKLEKSQRIVIFLFSLYTKKRATLSATLFRYEMKLN